MRKILAMLLTGAMMFSVVACGSNEEQPKEESKSYFIQSFLYQESQSLLIAFWQTLKDRQKSWRT